MNIDEKKIREDERDKVLERLLSIGPKALISIDTEPLRGWHFWKEHNLEKAIRGESV